MRRKEVSIVLLLLFLSVIGALYLENHGVNLLPDNYLSIYDDVKSVLFTDEVSNSPDVNQHEQQVASTENSNSQKTSIQLNKGYSPITHGNEYRCSNSKDTITTKPTKRIYSWVDGEGVTNLSDKRPTRSQAGIKIIDIDSVELDYFDINVTFPGGGLGSDISNHIRYSATQFYKIISSLIGLNSMSRAVINVRVYNDETAFQEYKINSNSSLDKSTPGFYSSGSNIAAVLHSGNFDRTTQIALHEVAHVINHASFGKLSSWINEGLAEYFENYNFNNKDSSISPNKNWLSQINSGRMNISLSNLLAAKDDNWKSENRSYYYAYSWALVYFLMEPRNREYMADYLYELSLDKCDETDSIAILSKIYPGGLNKLQSDWNKYLRSNIVSHRF